MTAEIWILCNRISILSWACKLACQVGESKTIIKHKDVLFRVFWWTHFSKTKDLVVGKNGCSKYDLMTVSQSLSYKEYLGKQFSTSRWDSSLENQFLPNLLPDLRGKLKPSQFRSLWEPDPMENAVMSTCCPSSPICHKGKHHLTPNMYFVFKSFGTFGTSIEKHGVS